MPRPSVQAVSDTAKDAPRIQRSLGEPGQLGRHRCECLWLCLGCRPFCLPTAEHRRHHRLVGVGACSQPADLATSLVSGRAVQHSADQCRSTGATWRESRRPQRTDHSGHRGERSWSRKASDLDSTHSWSRRRNWGSMVRADPIHEGRSPKSDSDGGEQVGVQRRNLPGDERPGRRTPLQCRKRDDIRAILGALSQGKHSPEPAGSPVGDRTERERSSDLREYGGPLRARKPNDMPMGRLCRRYARPTPIACSVGLDGTRRYAQKRDV